MPPALRTTSRSQYAPANHYIISRQTPSVQPATQDHPRIATSHCEFGRQRRSGLVQHFTHHAKNSLAEEQRPWPHDFSMPELKDFASSVAIVVSSCDAFFDAWRPFVFFFRKHWSDCPFPIFLIVNRLRVRSNFLQPITVGPDRDWASNMQVALAQITQPYVLYLQEDYFLNGP